MSKRLASLSDVCEFNPRLPAAIHDDEIAAFLPMAAVSENGSIAFEEERPIREVRKGYSYFERGDVLVAKITPCFENGKATRTSQLTKTRGFGSTEFHVLRAGEAIDPDYLFHLLWNDNFRAVASSNMTGSAGQKRVPVDFLKRLSVPVPPLDEQRRIAAILDKVDRLRRQRKRAVDLMAVAQKNSFQISSDQLNPDGEVRLGTNLTFMTTGGRNWSQYYAQEGDRFIRSLDVQMSKINCDNPVYVAAPANAEARRTRTVYGDVLLTVTGSRIGRVADLPAELDGSYVSQHVAILRPNPRKLRPRFLSWFLSSRRGQQQIAKWQYGQTKPGLNFDQIKNFEIPNFNLGDQKRIEKFIEGFDAVIGSQSTQMVCLDQLFSSLQSRAFTGGL